MTLGDEVEWTSQAGGNSKTKRGTIVAIVPAGWYPFVDQWNRGKVGLKAPYHTERIQGVFHTSTLGRGYAREKESFLVSVPTKTGKGRPRLYWPRVSQLSKV